MGKLAEQYKAYLKQNGLGDKAPDKAENPKGFQEWNVKNRKRDRFHQNYRNAFMNAGFSMEQIEKAVRGTVDEKKANGYLQHEAGDAYYDTLWDYVKTKRPDLVNELRANPDPDLVKKLNLKPGEDIVEKMSRNMGTAHRKLQKWTQAGKFTREEMDMAKTTEIIVSVMQGEQEEKEKFIEELEKVATEEQLTKVSNAVNNYVDIMDRQKDWIKRPFEETCMNLKANIPEALKNDPEKLKKYQHALDFAGEHLQEPDSGYQAEMASRERDDAQPLYVPIQEKIIQDNKATYKDGKYNEMFEMKRVNGSEMWSVKEGRQNDYTELRQDHMHVSEKTKKGMQEILKKMDDMDLYKYSVSANGEDGNKTYAFCKISDEQKELKKALASGDPDRIIAAEEKFEKTWNDMEQLFALAREHFSQDPTFFPGNMDSIRTASLPIHFTQDLVTAAQINNMFLTHLNLHNTNAKAEEWIENPSGTLVNNFLRDSEKGCFEETAREVSKSFEDSLDFLCEQGEFKKAGENYLLKSNVIMASRSIDGPLALESDKNIQNGNTIYIKEMGSILNRVVGNELCKFGYLKNKPLNETDRLRQQETMEKMIVVSDEDRNLNAMLGGIPETDLLGGIVSPGIDLNAYIAEHKPNYEEIMKRTEIFLEKQKKMKGIEFTEDDVREAAVSAYAKVLTAHMEDLESPEYQKMLKEFMDAPKKLSKDASKENVRRVQEIKNTGLSFINPEASLDDVDIAVEDAQKNVHMGSKEYDNAGEALKELKEAYRELNAIQNNSASGDAKEKIAEIREKIEIARENIDLYFERKARQGLYGENKTEEPSTKTQKRIDIMERAKGNLAAYISHLDNVEKQIDFQAERDRIQEAQNKEKKAIETTREEYKDTFETSTNQMVKYAAKGALAAHDSLLKIANEKGSDLISDKQMEIVKKGLGAMLLMEIVESPQGAELREHKPQNLYSYNQELNNMMKSEALGKVMPKTLSKSELKGILQDRTFVKNLQDKMNEELDREAKRDYKNQLDKEVQKNVNSGIQRGRSNAVMKNNETRGRSNAVHKPQTGNDATKPQAGNNATKPQTGMGGR